MEKEKLPPFTLAQLYGKSLVMIDEEIKADEPLPAISSIQKKYLGDYLKKIIVLVYDVANEFLSEDDNAFLTGVFQACKLQMNDVAVINFYNQPAGFQQLKKEMKPQFLLLFGVDALQAQLPFALPQYQVQQYDNCSILTSPSLTELNQKTQEAKAEKTKLWKSLQKMFSLEK